ncbi:hypothetical protein [Streptomyces sp. H27-C3]|uniref:hypothetical protein n=1 Tax=Streptomyces sp. H27-C3 TaxID=3046305 RepID=UPI0024B8DD1B|nr:hypothetical protein [Streptomyces sp. H27-C3]MDJ0461986.1 hypothetical protein [Streptomyces sp. H27-C3]
MTKANGTDSPTGEHSQYRTKARKGTHTHHGGSMFNRRFTRPAFALSATAAVFGLLSWTTTHPEPQPVNGHRVATEPVRELTGQTGPEGPATAPERPYVGPVAPAVPMTPSGPPAPAEDPATDADDGNELDHDAKQGPEPTKSPGAPTRTTKRRQPDNAEKPKKNQGEKSEKDAGPFGKDSVGSALDVVMPGTEDMVEKVPDWAWPFRAYLTTVADPGTAVELEVTATDPETDAVTVMATLTAADGPGDGTPIEVAVTVTPPADETPSEPVTVSVEVTNTETGESATTERETTPEAVTVVATVTTVATVADVLQDGYAPAA